MPEWWSYVPADFQLFSVRVFARLVEAHNRALWPAQWLMLGCGAVALAALLLRRRGAPRLLAALAALWCITLAWDFLLLRYAQIHWGAPHMAVGFAAQALLLAEVARRDAFAPAPTPVARAAALVLLAAALIGLPLWAPLSGLPWWRAEVVGLMPAPTLLALLAVVPLATPAARALLLPLPLAGCALEALTQASLEQPAWPLLPLAALGCIAAIAAPRRGARAPARRGAVSRA
ncbi:hypothetical protein [Azohydromonas aeria]|uniref:hypothetical protein n=1 Tax=Azohydromonas aeria TaxID=2590212 RepID=UPI0012FCC87D|nr:hypothetical protein [Azohydromonas aeria]